MRFIAHTTNPLDGDSVAGVLGAIKAGFAGADVNVHSTADGVIVALHWAAGGGWPLYPRADALTFAQCQARRNRKRTSARIPNITELLDAAEKADPGFVLCLEAKPSPGLEDPKVWRQVAGRNAIAMVIQRFRTATWEKAAIRRMAAAKAAGVPTMLLWRHHIPADSPWWGVIDAVKGAPHSQVVPAHVIRIPLGGMRPEKARAILHSVLAKGAGVPGPRPPKPDPRPPRPPKKVAKLKLAHASLQFSDTAKEREADIELLFKRGYDIMTGTEAGVGAGHGVNSTVELLKKYAAANGYHISLPGRYDTWVAVKKSIVAKDFKVGAEFALWRSSKTPGAKGRWGDKGVVWASWDMGPTFGKFAVCSVHPLTWGGTGTPELKRSTDTTYAKAVGKWIDSLPDEVSTFVGGDFNRVDSKYDLTMGQWPGASCWDDLRVHPNTGHGNIDAFLRDKRDSRVRCVSARVLDDKDLFLNTDHFLVEAVYEVTAL